jgi:hypothetical protein
LFVIKLKKYLFLSSKFCKKKKKMNFVNLPLPCLREHTASLLPHHSGYKAVPWHQVAATSKKKLEFIKHNAHRPINKYLNLLLFEEQK